jgi:hypothetical protein
LFLAPSPLDIVSLPPTAFSSLSLSLTI